MLLTERDMELMKWMNSLGCVTIELIAEKLNLKLGTVYCRMQKLVQEGFVLHERIYHLQPGVYRVSAKGVGSSGHHLPPLKNVPVQTLKHDLTVAKLSLILERTYGAQFMSERLLRHNLGLHGFRHEQHIPDGELHHQGKKIAIEVELSLKGQKRREKIFRNYAQSFEYDEVWYFCGTNEIYQKIKPYEAQGRFLKCHMLADLLDAEPTRETATC